MTFENINIRGILPAAISNNAIIVDVRTPESFYKKHIPMAINLPLEKITENRINLPKNRTLILYCDTGGASIRAAKILAEKGYKVINCVGGIKNYNGSTTKGS